ncbi:hypothetical protein [Ideonella sp. A 288]|uniref:hypothetical protein n=1 Tax=Ideonella sp. A 288 TaxID=1962181 RepID=UPI000B4A6765|nr:hypothetical protein [Ideonella sp. A 288]
MLVTAAMLGVIAEAGDSVLTLVDGLDEADFARSRLTRHEVRRQLLEIADALQALPEAAHDAMPEIDWPGWHGTATALSQAGPSADDAAWFAARSMVPATLMWLQVYRRAEPDLFEFRPH